MANVGYRGAATTGDVQTLTQAYSTLASADQDYQGHRIKAMQALKKAARLMGQKLGGDGTTKKPEQQTASDAQLSGVKGMLQKVRTSVSGRNQQRVVQHINEAIHHLSVALTVK
jgi:CBS-domain-containing membrane protein